MVQPICSDDHPISRVLWIALCPLPVQNYVGSTILLWRHHDRCVIQSVSCALFSPYYGLPFTTGITAGEFENFAAKSVPKF